MPLEIITNLIPITEGMSLKDKINAKTANDTVEYVAKTLKESPMNDYDKGDKQIVYTLTAHIDKPFSKEVQITPL